MSLRKVSTIATLIALACMPTASVFAQEIPMEGPVPTTALISAESKKDVPLDPAMLKLDVNGRPATIEAITPVQPATAQLAILIDDGLRSSFDLELDDLSKFLTQLPAGMQVMVGYMRNGTVIQTQGFTADHAAVAAQLRISIASAGVNASPYFCLSEFVKHWPLTQPGPRFVMMFTNGVDPYNGSTSLLNQDSPYVQSAQEDAERAGVAVYSIYFGDVGARGERANVSGQGYLSQVAEATGGRTFYEGFGNPVSIGPFLAQFRKAIAESYTVRFEANAGHDKRDTLTRIKLKTSQSGIKLHVPDSVHPGLAE